MCSFHDAERIGPIWPFLGGTPGPRGVRRAHYDRDLCASRPVSVSKRLRAFGRVRVPDGTPEAVREAVRGCERVRGGHAPIVGHA